MSGRVVVVVCSRVVLYGRVWYLLNECLEGRRGRWCLAVRGPNWRATTHEPPLSRSKPSSVICHPSLSPAPDLSTRHSSQDKAQPRPSPSFVTLLFYPSVTQLCFKPVKCPFCAVLLRLPCPASQPGARLLDWICYRATLAFHGLLRLLLFLDLQSLETVTTIASQ